MTPLKYTKLVKLDMNIKACLRIFFFFCHFIGYRPRFVHTRQTRSLSVEFEGQIYDIDLQADDRSAVRRRVISKRHYNPEDPEFHLGSDDGSEEMLADDTNAVGYPHSVKVTHK